VIPMRQFSFFSPPRDERGVSLIELVIYLVLLSGIAIIATNLFLITNRSEKQVLSSTQATVNAQGIAQGIERSVRNAFRVQLSNCVTNSPVPTNCTELLSWTTLAGDSTCQAWRLSTATPAFIEKASGATSVGSFAPFGTGVTGATLSLTYIQHNGSASSYYDGVEYVVSFPYGDAGKAVTVKGRVTSRTPHNTIASVSTCGTAA
jgi:Tfp pilus assembly protein FimT